MNRLDAMQGRVAGGKVEEEVGQEVGQEVEEEVEEENESEEEADPDQGEPEAQVANPPEDRPDTSRPTSAKPTAKTPKKMGRPREAISDEYEWEGSEFFPREKYPSFPKLPGYMMISRYEDSRELQDASHYPLSYTLQELADRGGAGRYAIDLYPLPQDGRPGRFRAMARRTIPITQGRRKMWPPQDLIRSPDLESIGEPERPFEPAASRAAASPPPPFQDVVRPMSQQDRSRMQQLLGSEPAPSQTPWESPPPNTNKISFQINGQKIEVSNADSALAAIFGMAQAVVPSLLGTVERQVGNVITMIRDDRNADRTRIRELEEKLYGLYDRVMLNDKDERQEWMKRLENVEQHQIEMLEKVFAQGIEYNKSFSIAIADYADKLGGHPVASLPASESSRDLARLEGMVMDIKSSMGTRNNPGLDELKAAFETVDAVNQRLKTQMAQFSEAAPVVSNGGGSTAQGGVGGLVSQFLTPQNVRMVAENIDRFAAAAKIFLSEQLPQVGGAPGTRPSLGGAPRVPSNPTIGTGLPSVGR